MKIPSGAVQGDQSATLEKNPHTETQGQYFHLHNINTDNMSPWPESSHLSQKVYKTKISYFRSHLIYASFFH